mgnify:CR=1 FL=1
MGNPEEEAAELFLRRWRQVLQRNPGRLAQRALLDMLLEIVLARGGQAGRRRCSRDVA